MKKNFLLLLALVGLTFVSCKKEVTVTPSSSSNSDTITNQNVAEDVQKKQC